MIAEKIEHVLTTWSQHIQAGELPMHVYTLGCERLQDAANRLRNLTAAVDHGSVGCPVLAENIGRVHCGRSQASRSSDPLSGAMRERCPSCPNAPVGQLAYEGADELSKRLESVLERWRSKGGRKGPDMVTFVMGCCTVREVGAQVRTFEATEIPADIAEMEIEALQRHFADLIDPDPRYARTRD
ncbi:MAG: hypothetical protein RIB84_22405 [Sneathiellaceae bacterium]